MRTRLVVPRGMDADTARGVRPIRISDFTEDLKEAFSDPPITFTSMLSLLQTNRRRSRGA